MEESLSHNIEANNRFFQNEILGIPHFKHLSERLYDDFEFKVSSLIWSMAPDYKNIVKLLFYFPKQKNICIRVRDTEAEALKLTPTQKEHLLSILPYLVQARGSEEDFIRAFCGPIGITGYKVKAGQHMGHNSTHGTLEEKQARWNSFQTTVNELCQKHPQLSLTRIRQLAAQAHSVSFKTIQNRTFDPRILKK
ncbi:MAG: hypothetical protein DI585_01450 [Pseudomonas fluorescens]|nr:MAG: hypothetical protein DI585_01450 [Pseudomonas fluorescens]